MCAIHLQLSLEEISPDPSHQILTSQEILTLGQPFFHSVQSWKEFISFSSKHVALNCFAYWVAYLTLLSTDFSLVGGLVTGLFVLITLPWCCSFPALLYLFLLGLGVPYFLRI